MKIAFYAPLKPVDHPVPSGDRLMGRLLVAALSAAGHEVTVASDLRVYLREPSATLYQDLKAKADRERERLALDWQSNGVPDLWFTYHPYYKSPDLIGVPLAREFGLSYVTAEASYSARRNIGMWSEAQEIALSAMRQAAVNICFTRRDREGLEKLDLDLPTAMLPPFLNSSAMRILDPAPEPNRLLTIAMMREGNKIESYRMLALALAQLIDVPWTLDIVGDGPLRPEVEQAFADFAPGRIAIHGLKTADELAVFRARASIFLWPGCREAYGLSYLEAQAAGLPVIGQDEAGVPEVVVNGRTGILTASRDIGAYAAAIRHMLSNAGERARLALGARQFACEERSFEAATTRLTEILNHSIGGAS